VYEKIALKQHRFASAFLVNSQQEKMQRMHFEEKNVVSQGIFLSSSQEVKHLSCFHVVIEDCFLCR
jgi:uncharacterized protein YaaR (DUF327 family)